MDKNNEYFQCTAAPKAGRVDSFLSKESGISRSKIKKYIEEGFLKINKDVCVDSSRKLVEGEELLLTIPQVSTQLVAAQASLKILYQDEDIAVIEKPHGLTVHPCPSCTEETLVHQLLHHFPQLKELEGERPGIVHRLDKETSGLMIIALHEEARLRLSEDFSERLIHKVYLALVAGQCPSGESRKSIGRHPKHKTKMAIVPENQGGRDAFSVWTKLYPFNKENSCPFSLLQVQIHTGRTHQIRVHLSDAGYALLGDSSYASREVAALAPRQMLHAWKLEFEHPMTGEPLGFVSPPPQDFTETAQTIFKDMFKRQQIIVTGASGVGKSAILEIFRKNAVPTFSADAYTQELYLPNGDAHYILEKQYGTRFVPNPDEAVDKKALLEAMQDTRFRKEIQNIVHPLVYAKMRQFFTSSFNAENTSHYAVAEIPLWHEGNQKQEKEDYVVICIACEQEKRLERLRKRGWSEELIAQIDSWQWKQEDKIKQSQYAIDNSGSLEDLEQKYLNVLEQIEGAVQAKVESKLNEMFKTIVSS